MGWEPHHVFEVDRSKEPLPCLQYPYRGLILPDCPRGRLSPVDALRSASLSQGVCLTSNHFPIQTRVTRRRNMSERPIIQEDKPVTTGDIRNIRPYRGTVTATFSDAVIASSENALVADAGDARLFFFPQEDVYLEFLSRSHDRPATSDDTRDWWDVSAVGEGHSQAAWSPNETADSYGRLQGHFCFDQVALGIEANPEPTGENSTELP